MTGVLIRKETELNREVTLGRGSKRAACLQAEDRGLWRNQPANNFILNFSFHNAQTVHFFAAIQSLIRCHASPSKPICLLWTSEHLRYCNCSTIFQETSQITLSLSPYCAQSLRSVLLFQQEHWSGLPFPPWGDLPSPGIEPASPA